MENIFEVFIEFNSYIKIFMCFVFEFEVYLKSLLLLKMEILLILSFVANCYKFCDIFCDKTIGSVIDLFDW